MKIILKTFEVNVIYPRKWITDILELDSSLSIEIKKNLIAELIELHENTSITMEDILTLILDRTSNFNKSNLVHIFSQFGMYDFILSIAYNDNDNI